MVERVLLPFDEKGMPKRNVTPAPAWGYTDEGRLMIRCQCGLCMGIADHVVHDDGRVDPSLWHPTPSGCGWHVFGTLDGYAEHKR